MAAWVRLSLGLLPALEHGGVSGWGTVMMKPKERLQFQKAKRTTKAGANEARINGRKPSARNRLALARACP